VCCVGNVRSTGDGVFMLTVLAQLMLWKMKTTVSSVLLLWLVVLHTLEHRRIDRIKLLVGSTQPGVISQLFEAHASGTYYSMSKFIISTHCWTLHYVVNTHVSLLGYPER
jgi:hypothetical protein